MKTIATLIKKEFLPTNFKLTFMNKNKGIKLFVFLHENKKDIFDELKISSDYSFSWYKGRKKYSFVNPQSLKAIRNQYLPIKPNHDIKNLFFNNLIKSLKIGELNEENIKQKLSSLFSGRSEIRQNENQTLMITWMREVLTTLYLKHKNIKGLILDERGQEEKELLNMIDTILFFDKL